MLHIPKAIRTTALLAQRAATYVLRYNLCYLLRSRTRMPGIGTNLKSTLVLLMGVSCHPLQRSHTLKGKTCLVPHVHCLAPSPSSHLCDLVLHIPKEGSPLQPCCGHIRPQPVLLAYRATERKLIVAAAALLQPSHHTEKCIPVTNTQVIQAETPIRGGGTDVAVHWLLRSTGLVPAGTYDVLPVICMPATSWLNFTAHATLPR